MYGSGNVEGLIPRLLWMATRMLFGDFVFFPGRQDLSSGMIAAVSEDLTVFYLHLEALTARS